MPGRRKRRLVGGELTSRPKAPVMMVRERPEDVQPGVILTDGEDHFHVLDRSVQFGRDSVYLENPRTGQANSFSMQDVNAAGSIGELYFAGFWR